MFEPHCIALVTPVWNDSRRLAAFAPELVAAIRRSGLPIVWVIADDGSNSGEQDRLRAIADQAREAGAHVDLVHLEARSCKGGAIYRAWDAYPAADWLAFVDADGAVGADSVVELLRRAMALGEDGCAIAVRSHSEATPVRRDFGRRLSFHVFRLLVRYLVGLNVADSQCGAKVVSGRIYRSCAGRLRERGFIFDVELLILLKAHGAKLSQMPVAWEAQAGGKIRPGRDGWRMLQGLLRIRRRMRSGAYCNTP